MAKLVTVSVPVYFSAGEFTLQIVVEGGGWNINWFEIAHLDAASTAESSVVLSGYEWTEGSYGDGEVYSCASPSTILVTSL